MKFSLNGQISANFAFSIIISSHVIWFSLHQKVEGKGHVKPANYLDSLEKHLIGVATRGGTPDFIDNGIIVLQRKKRSIF